MAETPITRKERYLAKISGQSVSVPYPVTREEQYLYEIAVNGGGGGGSGSNSIWIGTQEEYEDLDSKTYDLYMIYEDEEEFANVSNLASVNSIFPMYGTMNFNDSFDDALDDSADEAKENYDTLEISNPETETSTEEVNPIADLAVQGDETA